VQQKALTGITQLLQPRPKPRDKGFKQLKPTSGALPVLKNHASARLPAMEHARLKHAG